MKCKLGRVLALILGVALPSAAYAQEAGEEASGLLGHPTTREFGGPREQQLYMDAARTAWAFVERNYQPETGLVRAHDTYEYVTVWDIASGLAALYSARGLGLLTPEEYNDRMQRALGTLQQLQLFEGAAYNKLYSASTGEAVGRDEKPTERGFGWSATDLGRLLVWLKIIAEHDPQFAEEIDTIVGRLDFARLVRDGYLWGEDLNPGDQSIRRYPEGRIGYEQYAAAGYSLWGAEAERALNVQENADSIEVLGVPLYADRRGGDRLTSDPFVLSGLELGWQDPEWRELAESVLAAQKARYDKTGQITIVNEDALPDPPYYFYYYTIYQDGDEFVVDAQGPTEGVDLPRWISTKGAFGWHSLMPGPYTWKAVQAVQPARDPGEGWSAGIYEGSGEPTGSANINTAAVILESALYQELERPLIELETEER